MKADLHPVYGPSEIICGCGHKWETRSTQAEQRIDVCAQCHPFFTGKVKLMDTEGRIERFRKKYAKKDAPAAAKTEEPAAETKDAPAAE